MADRWYDGTFYKREITINYMDCNSEKKVFLHHILGIISEIAGDECESNGQTHEFFASFGKVFFITRMGIRFHRTPSCGETLVLRTWFRKVDGKFFLRDCDIRSSGGELIASVTGTWVLFDPVQHMLLGVEDYPGIHSKSFDMSADSPECKKIVPQQPLPVIGTRPVYYTDIDCNHHVNNSVYSKIATDFLPPEYQQREVQDFVINFNKQTRLDETFEIRGGISEDAYIIQGYCDDVLHFGCEFKFREMK